jgi:hypothetical protein
VKIATDQFESGIQYLSGFADRDSSVLFTPLSAGSLVIASVVGQVGQGEYLFRPTEPLAERFAVRASTIASIAAVASGDDVEYRPGSSSMFVSGSASWWVPYVSIDEVPPRMDVDPESWVSLDGKSIKWLSMMRVTVCDKDQTGVLDCVLLDVKANQDGRSGRRTWVSCDRAAMLVVDTKDVDCSHSVKLLIEGRLIPLIMATCESGSAVEIRVGISRYSVQCGKRTATFGLRRGVYPREWVRVHESTSKMSLAGHHAAIVSRESLWQAVRQSGASRGAVEISTDYRGVVVRSAEEEIESEIVIASEVLPGLGPVVIKGSYARRLSELWPSERIEIYSSDSKSPVVLRGGAAVAVVQPLVRS